MTREDEVTQRVHQLARSFGQFVAAYDAAFPFTSKQLAAHRETVELRSKAGSVAAAVNDPFFLASLYRTLVAWGLGKRGSRLVAAPHFETAVREAVPQLSALEPLRIDADALPEATPEALWHIISTMRITDNDAKIVAGTKALHHLLPDLVPPMDRAWTGRFFALHDPEWQGAAQRRTFLRLYLKFVDIACAAQPQVYVTGDGWRTSRTKIIDNALIGFYKTGTSGPLDGEEQDGEVTFRVAGYPPAKNEAISMLGQGHSHAPRVRALLTAAGEALQAHPTFNPFSEGAIALDLTVHATTDDEPWDATNYLGGVADVLEDKSRRSQAVAHLGDLARVWLYRNDRQIKNITYREQSAATAAYDVTIRRLRGTG